MTRDEEEKKINEEIEKTISENEMPIPSMANKVKEEETTTTTTNLDPETLDAMQNTEGTPERQDLLDRIQHTLNKIRPYIQADGGDVQLIDYRSGIVTVSMLGACAGCMSLDVTLTDGIQAILIDEVPEVKSVQMLQTTQFGYEKI